ncbi:MAG: hypothetical protein U1E27_00895, partial [Kiritimatiellia bacterium]|nr:hypothetical protein [Kiritimatiellia bacterium]
KNTFSSRRYRPMWAGLAFVVAGGWAMAVEEAAYTAEKTDGIFEIRLYAPQIVAETVVEGPMEPPTVR